MGLLVDGQWQDKWYDTKAHGGKFVRSDTQFRHFLGKDPRFPVESDRYHLYASPACPWSHRALIFRELKKLRDIIGLTVVHPHLLENGWELKDEQGNNVDDLYHLQYLYQLYLKADPHYSGRVTVPVLWDKKEETIVSNESSDIVRMFNSAFNDVTGDKEDFYPSSLQKEIDSVNDMIYQHINNGVYQCGFATSQAAYDEAFKQLFAALNDVEFRLSQNNYLLGDQLTEADWRLFVTLIRFDPVYYGHFKANLKRIKDYPYLAAYLKNLYHYPGIAQTVDMHQIKQHYYFSHKNINPTQIVPDGPDMDYVDKTLSALS